MVKLLLLLIAVFYGRNLVQTADSDVRIVFGKYAELGQFPYQVTIQREYNTSYSQHHCAGGIIGRSWVLTSAQCIDHNTTKKFSVVAGIVGLDLKSHQIQIHKVKQFVRHPDFDRPNEYNLAIYDFGIVEIEDQFKYNKYVKPLKLPACVYKPKGDATLAGWGGVDQAGNVRPDMLKYTTIHVPNQTVCDKYYPEFKHDLHFCSNPVKGEGACFGDEGGPLVQNWKVIGVVSKVDYPCGTNGVPTVFSKVSKIVPYLKKIINK